MKKIIIILSIFILLSCNNNYSTVDKKINNKIETSRTELELPSNFNFNEMKSYFENKQIINNICLNKNNYFEKYGKEAIIELCKKFEYYNNKNYLTKDYYISFNSDLVIKKDLKDRHIFINFNILKINFNFKNGENIKVNDFKYDGKIFRKGENSFIIFPKILKDNKLFFPKLEFNGIKYDFDYIEQYSYVGNKNKIKKDKEVFDLICSKRQDYIEKFGKFFIDNLCNSVTDNKKLKKSDISINYGCDFQKKIKGQKVCFLNKKGRGVKGIHIDINEDFKIEEKNFIFKSGGKIKLVGPNSFILFPSIDSKGKEYFPKFSLKGIEFDFHYNDIYNENNNYLVYNKICKDKETIEINNENHKYTGVYDGNNNEIKYKYIENNNYLIDFCKKNIEFKK